MKIDRAKISQYLTEITKNTAELKALLEANRLQPASLELKAAKYILIELAEGVANVLQHTLAKAQGIAVNGYLDAINKAYRADIISKDLFHKLKPFLDFRHSLIHRYWVIDDTLLIKNMLGGYQDFFQFVEEIEAYVRKFDSSHENSFPPANHSSDGN